MNTLQILLRLTRTTGACIMVEGPLCQPLNIQESGNLMAKRQTCIAYISPAPIALEKFYWQIWMQRTAFDSMTLSLFDSWEVPPPILRWAGGVGMRVFSQESPLGCDRPELQEEAPFSDNLAAQCASIWVLGRHLRLGGMMGVTHPGTALEPVVVTAEDDLTLAFFRNP